MDKNQLNITTVTILNIALPYHAGQAFYRLALRPPDVSNEASNAHPVLTYRVLKPLVFANMRIVLQCSCLRSLGPKKYLPKNSHRFLATAQQLPLNTTAV